MAALNLRLDEPGVPMQQQAFDILYQALQPEADMTVKSAATEISKLLPGTDPESDTVFTVLYAFFEAAFQIPYDHPSMTKLAAILAAVQTTAKPFVSEDGVTPHNFQYATLSMTLRDEWNSYCSDDSDVAETISFHRFAAEVELSTGLYIQPTLAVWTMKRAFEEDNSSPKYNRVPRVMAAAQMMSVLGGKMFERFRDPKVADRDKITYWQSDRFKGASALSIRRWHFWPDGFLAFAADEETGGKGAVGNKDYAEFAFGVADKMDQLEQASGGNTNQTWYSRLLEFRP